MLEEAGFVDIEIGDAVDVFAGARGEAKARSFETVSLTFYARRGPDPSP